MRLARILTLASTAIAAVSASHHTSYTIHRRLLDPSHPSPFTPYGTVETDIDVASYALALRANTGAIVPPHGKFVPAEHHEEAGEGQVDVSRAWVQVTVEIEGRDEEEWPRSAVKAVSTPEGSSDVLVAICGRERTIHESKFRCFCADGMISRCAALGNLSQERLSAKNVRCAGAR